jgi:hypothetical protein
MLPNVIGLPDGCFALTMPGAYPHDILHAIICGAPRAAFLLRTFANGAPVLGATRSATLRGPACEGSAPSAEPASGGAARGVARGQWVSDTLAGLRFVEPDYWQNALIAGFSLSASTAARYI